MYIGIVHTHAHRTVFPVKFLQPYGTFVPVFCIPYGQKKGYQNWRNEVVWRFSIFTGTVSSLKVAFDTTLESLHISVY